MEPIATQILLGIVLMLVGYLASSLSAIKRQLADLHKWHAPNEAGKMTWMWDGEQAFTELTNAIVGLRRDIRELIRVRGVAETTDGG